MDNGIREIPVKRRLFVWGLIMKLQKGFTLIELLVVIAIIALLLSIVMPGLNLAKKKAASIVCMTNAKNLALGWYSYKEDNNDRIMSARMNGLNIDGKRVPGWIKRPHTAPPANTPLQYNTANVVTDEDEIRGIEDGALHPYLKSPDVFNCPADKVKSRYDTVDPEKFVTYGMPRCLAGQGVGSAGNRVTKFSEIKTPGNIYNFVEMAQERNYTASGWFSFGAPELTGGGPAIWWDPMSVNHGDSSILGFCDGHAEVKKWQSSWTKERIVRLSALGVNTYDPDTASGHNSSNNEDIAYVAKGWAYRYKQ
jgi:prepilin-type N-terminal cleavage/methylation domain-containing protein/prepilin-type processing-associated H-X9-DG protein